MISVLETNYYKSLGVLSTLKTTTIQTSNFEHFALQILTESINDMDNLLKRISSITSNEAKEHLLYLKTVENDFFFQKQTIQKLRNHKNSVVFSEVLMQFISTAEQLIFELQEVVIDHNIGQILEKKDSEIYSPEESKSIFKNYLSKNAV